MPSVVIKPSRDRDRYVVWSTVVDNVCEIGTRNDMARILARDVPDGYDPKPGNSPEDRLRRADECGTSALFWAEPPYFGAFDDTGMVIEGWGWLPRARLAEYCDAMERGDAKAAEALVEQPDDEA